MYLSVFYIEIRIEEYRPQALKQEAMQTRLIAHIMPVTVLVIATLHELIHILIGMQVMPLIETL